MSFIQSFLQWSHNSILKTVAKARLVFQYQLTSY
jgi:hypothetical protein